MIIQTDLKWGYTPSRFTQPVKYLVLHHAAGNGSVEAIHAYHRDTNGWAGIAYHLYVRKDGKVYAGRPMNCQGGHCLNYNGVSVGICFEGNFQTETMSVAQIDGGVEAINYAMVHYPGMKIVGHRELVSTDCPGKNFPLDYFKHYDEHTDAPNKAKEEDMDLKQFKELWTEMRKEFQDNDSSAYSDKAREWAVSNGIIQGNGNDNYMWEDILTREQMVTILYRFAKMQNGGAVK